jgi:hypothetical protein
VLICRPADPEAKGLLERPPLPPDIKFMNHTACPPPPGVQVKHPAIDQQVGQRPLLVQHTGAVGAIRPGSDRAVVARWTQRQWPLPDRPGAAILQVGSADQELAFQKK